MEAKKSAEEFSHGIKADSSVKGHEAMRGPDMEIKENSIESEILISSDEKLQDFLSGDDQEKRFKINGGAVTSSEKQKLDYCQPILGLSSNFEEDSEAEHDED